MSIIDVEKEKDEVLKSIKKVVVDDRTKIQTCIDLYKISPVTPIDPHPSIQTLSVKPHQDQRDLSGRTRKAASSQRGPRGSRSRKV
jgi:hypothetical protein